MSEVTDVRKLEIFKEKLKAKPTDKELEAILMDCATCPSKALGVMAAGAIQDIFLDPEYEGDRIAIIESEAFSLISKNLNDLLSRFSKHMYNPEYKKRYKARQEQKLLDEKQKLLDEMKVIEAADPTPERWRYEPRG